MSDANIIRAALFTPGPRGLWGLPFRLVGEPGTAKSDIMVQVAANAGLHVKVLIASLREPADFLGLPVVRGDGTVGNAPPDWVSEVLEHPHSAVFFDEINTCPPAVQAVLLRIVLDRVVGEVRLPSTVRMIAAQNGVDDSAGGYDVSSSLANRFGTLCDWRAPDAEAWSAWLVGEGGFGAEPVGTVDPVALQERVLERWHADYAWAAGHVSTFVQRKPSILHAKPEAGSPQASLAWPSRRTWAMATRALAASRAHGLTEEETDRYVGAFVGQAAVVELRSFIQNCDLPHPADFLDGLVEFRHDDSRMDRTMAVLASCSALVVPRDADRRVERAAVLWSFIRQVMAKAADVAFPTVKVLCKKGVGLERDGEVFNEDASAVLTRFQPMLAAAGLMRG